MEQYSRLLLRRDLQSLKEGWSGSESEEESIIKIQNFESTVIDIKAVFVEAELSV